MIAGIGSFARRGLPLAAWVLSPLTMAADAAALAIDERAVSETGISGYPGSASSSFELDVGDKGITEISWKEMKDEPCSIRITGKDPAHANRTAADDYGHCVELSGGSEKTVNFEDNPRYFVRGLAVCTNKKDNHRLKGIRIYAAKLPANSDVFHVTTVTDQASRTNCAIWHSAVYCPTSKVANGVNVRVKDGGIVGLGLRCAAVTATPPASVETVRTSFSGYPGNPSEGVHLFLPGGGAVWAVSWGERSNRPCYIRITGRDPDRPGGTRSNDMDLCEYEVAQRKHVGFAVSNPRYFVRGLAVCTNDKENHRLKGLRIFASRLPVHSSKVEPIVSSDGVRDAHTANCADWHKTVYCAADEVAAGLDVRVKDGALVGLGMICRARASG